MGREFGRKEEINDPSLKIRIKFCFSRCSKNKKTGYVILATGIEKRCSG
jgi:hypothetical protein